MAQARESTVDDSEKLGHRFEHGLCGVSASRVGDSTVSDHSDYNSVIA